MTGPVQEEGGRRVPWLNGPTAAHYHGFYRAVIVHVPYEDGSGGYPVGMVDGVENHRAPRGLWDQRRDEWYRWWTSEPDRESHSCRAQPGGASSHRGVRSSPWRSQRAWACPRGSFPLPTLWPPPPPRTRDDPACSSSEGHHRVPGGPRHEA